MRLEARPPALEVDARVLQPFNPHAERDGTCRPALLHMIARLRVEQHLTAAKKHRGRTATGLFIAHELDDHHCADHQTALAQYPLGRRTACTLAVEAASHNDTSSLEQHASAAWGSARANA